MATQKQVYLAVRREPLQFVYPPDFAGEKSGDLDDEEFFLGQEPRFLTADEIELVEEILASLPYTQKLVKTGCVLIDPYDPLLEVTHDRLDEIEAQQKLPSSRKAPGGGTVGIRERVLRIRENGYEGYGNKSLPEGLL